MSARPALPPAALHGMFRAFLANYATDRASLFARMGGSVGLDAPGRNLAAECGYPTHPTTETYRELYNRWGVATRAVNIWPDECFAVYPQVYETERDVNTRFERALKDLNKRIPFAHYLHRADRLSGIGHYGGLLFGLPGKLDTPAPGLDGKTGRPAAKKSQKTPELYYLRPFSEDLLKVTDIDADPNSPRCGQPTWYSITLAAPAGGLSGATVTARVHWTRVLHVADNREASDVAGVPRLRAVLNYLLDLRKIGGGSAEMFWKGAFPGYSFETVPDALGESVMDEESIKEQFFEYMNGLKRYLALDGVTAKALLPQAVDPTAHATQQLAMICATIGVPMRIFMGTEAGHLASSQDGMTWNRRVAERQSLYLEPMVIRPFVDRLTAMGILPAPAGGDYHVAWRDLNTMSDKDKALVALQRSQALMQYVSGGCEAVMPVKTYLTTILGLTDAEAAANMTALTLVKTPLTDPLGVDAAARETDAAMKIAKVSKPVAVPGAGGKKKTKPQGGGKVGNAPRRSAGRPASP